MLKLEPMIMKLDQVEQTKMKKMLLIHNLWPFEIYHSPDDTSPAYSQFEWMILNQI